MSILNAKDTEKLRDYLKEHLEGPVSIDLFTRPDSKIVVPEEDECQTCEQAQQLLEEVAALSDEITLSVHDARTQAPLPGTDGEIPAFVLRGKSRGAVRFLGIPTGREFPVFLDALIDVSSGTSEVADYTRQILADLETDIHIRVFVTPNCAYCPSASTIAHKLAVESDRVTADVVDITEFQDLAERFAVRGVPKIVINDEVELVGSQHESQFVNAVLEAADASGGTQ